MGRRPSRADEIKHLNLGFIPLRELGGRNSTTKGRRCETTSAPRRLAFAWQMGKIWAGIGERHSLIAVIVCMCMHF